MSRFSAFLKKKDIVFTVDRYLIKAMSAIAQGLFATLLVGTIVKTVGEQLDLQYLAEIGKFAQSMMGPAIGVAVAHALGAPPLVLFTSVVTGAAGSTLGGPAGAFVAALFGAEFLFGGQFCFGKEFVGITDELLFYGFGQQIVVWNG